MMTAKWMVSSVASSIGALLVFCILLFLVGEVLNNNFPKGRMLFEAIKALALATIPAILIVLYDHKVTIRRVGDEVTRQIQTAMTSMLEQFVIGSLKAGLIAFHEHLDFAKLFDDLQPGDELLWLDTYCPRNAEFIEKISPALERGAKLRLLIINPKCETSKLRAQEITGEYDPSTFAQETEVFTRRIKAVFNKANDSLREACKIRIYDDLPCMPMYIITRNGIPTRGYTGFFLSKPSAFFVHLEWVPAEGGMLEHLHYYFEQKWKANEGKQGIRKVA
jgi:hypothetical protein